MATFWLLSLPATASPPSTVASSLRRTLADSGLATVAPFALPADLRVGTLDEPDRLPPDIHIFTESKQPWVILPPDRPAVPAYYEREKHWPAESLARREAVGS